MLGVWADAVGPFTAKHTTPLRIQENKLFVEVDHPIWRQELHAQKQKILDVYNARLRTHWGDRTPPSTIIDLILVQPQRQTHQNHDKNRKNSKKKR